MNTFLLVTNILCTEFLQALASIGVAIAAVPYIAIAVPVLGGVLYALQLFYLRTSRQLRLLELVIPLVHRYCLFQC